MKIVRIDWREKNEDFEFVPLGDLHIGSKFTDYRFLSATFSYIADNGLYVLGMGDYLQFETKTSVGDKFECDLSNEEQIDWFTKRAKKVKLIGLLSGNHDGGRSSKDASVNIVKVMADNLETEFLEDFGIIVVQMKNISYTICAWHGHGSASTDYGVYKKMLAVRDKKFRDADLYLQAHYHRFKKFPEQVFFALPRNKHKIIMEKQYFFDTGSFQKYSTYADRFNLAPVELGCWKFTLKNSKRKEFFFEKLLDF